MAGYNEMLKSAVPLTPEQREGESKERGFEPSSKKELLALGLPFRTTFGCRPRHQKVAFNFPNFRTTLMITCGSRHATNSIQLRGAFRRDSSSKPETDEIRLVRDQGCMVDDLSAPNQELQHGFALLSPNEVSHRH
ncbi:hypothetical protein TNCV_5137141 [Trichonephila clavipes]|nr:hypothetical protein TNCV_5137141 [Trichonephila clavipes]